MDRNDTLVVISDGHTHNMDHNDALVVISDGNTQHGS